MKNLLAVFIGGGIGACFRYLLALFLLNYNITFQGTFIINIIGCLFFGFVTYIAIKREKVFSSELKLFLTTGIAGGFTTFSTFSFELVSMLTSGLILNAFLYMTISMVMGLFAIGLGMFAARKVLLLSLNLKLIQPVCKLNK